MDSNNTNRFADLARLADRVQTYLFNRRTRLIILRAIGVLTSTVAALQLDTNNAYQVDSNNTNRFADLARLVDRVETYGFNRRTHPIIQSAIAVLTSTVGALQLELSRKYRQRESS